MYRPWIFITLLVATACGSSADIGGSKDDGGTTTTTCPGYALGTTSITLSNDAEIHRILTEHSRVVGDLASQNTNASKDLLAACRAIGTDIGATKPAMEASATEWCRASGNQIKAMGLSFTVSPLLTCSPSQSELDACNARCASTSCANACVAVANIRGTCDNPPITVTVKGSGSNVATLQKTLDTNLPAVWHLSGESKLRANASSALTNSSAALVARQLDKLGLACAGRITDDTGAAIKGMVDLLTAFNLLVMTGM